MVRRPLATLAAVLSAAAALVVPLAASAQAEGSCTLTPPARIAIYKNITITPANISGDCVPNGYAYWAIGNVFGEYDDFAVVEYDPTDGQPGVVYVPDRPNGGYGPQIWDAYVALRDSECDFVTPPDRETSPNRSAECEDLSQNSPASDIRLGTYGAVAGTRNSASKVTFTVTSAIWSTGGNKLINRSMKGELQTQYADGTWHKVGNSVATGTNGKATFAVSLPQRTWRFAVYSTPYSFDRASSPITR